MAVNDNYFHAYISFIRFFLIFSDFYKYGEYIIIYDVLQKCIYSSNTFSKSYIFRASWEYFMRNINCLTVLSYGIYTDSENYCLNYIVPNKIVLNCLYEHLLAVKGIFFSVLLDNLNIHFLSLNYYIEEK